MRSVFVLQHAHTIENGEDDVKLIGVYSSNEKAEKAISRLIQQPGFKDTQNGFYIDEYEIDLDHWADGFVSIVNK